MGNVSLIYTAGNLWVNRAAVKGFVNQTGVTNSHISGDVWVFEYTPAAVIWQMKIHPKFFPPTSNTYNFDYVFDLPNSFSYVGGVPTPTFLNFGLMYVQGEGLPRLGTLPGSFGDASQRADLAPLSGYWLPSQSPP